MRVKKLVVLALFLLFAVPASATTTRILPAQDAWPVWSPTGKEVDFEEIALLKFADGKIIVSWFQTDLLKMMSQLGVGGEAPAPA